MYTKDADLNIHDGVCGCVLTGEFPNLIAAKELNYTVVGSEVPLSHLTLSPKSVINVPVSFDHSLNYWSGPDQLQLLF